MALKLVSRGGNAKQEDNSLSSWIRTPVNTAISLASSVPQFAQNVGRSLADLAPSRRGGMPELTKELYEGPSVQEQVRSDVEKSQKLPEGSLEPKGFLEKTINKTASSLPLVLGSGGTSLPAIIGSDLSSSAGMTAAEEFGAGPVGQVIGGLIGGKLFNKAHAKWGQGKHIPKLKELAETSKKEFYDTEAKLGAKINAPSKKYLEGLKNLAAKIEDNTALALGEKQELINKLGQYEIDAAKGTVNAAKLVQREKELNALWPQIQGPKNRVYREFVGQTRNLIEDTGKAIGKKHPKWLNSWQSAKDIVKAQNFKSELGELIEDYPKIAKLVANPLVKGLFGVGAGGVLGGVGGAAVGALGGLGVNKAERLWGFYRQPAGAKLLEEAVKNIWSRNIPALEKTLLKLNQEAKHYEKKHPEEKSKLKLVSRG